MPSETKDILTDERIRQDIKNILKKYRKVIILLANVWAVFSIGLYTLVRLSFFEKTTTYIIIGIIPATAVICAFILSLKSIKYRRAYKHGAYRLVTDKLVAQQKFHGIKEYYGFEPKMILHFKKYGKYNIAGNIMANKRTFTFYNWSHKHCMTVRDIYATSSPNDSYYLVTLNNKKIALIYNSYYFEYAGKKLTTTT